MITQHMSFLSDLPVYEFLSLHAKDETGDPLFSLLTDHP